MIKQLFIMVFLTSSLTMAFAPQTTKISVLQKVKSAHQKFAFLLLTMMRMIILKKSFMPMNRILEESLVPLEPLTMNS